MWIFDNLGSIISENVPNQGSLVSENVSNKGSIGQKMSLIKGLLCRKISPIEGLLCPKMSLIRGLCLSDNITRNSTRTPASHILCEINSPVPSPLQHCGQINQKVSGLRMCVLIPWSLYRSSCWSC